LVAKINGKQCIMVSCGFSFLQALESCGCLFSWQTMYYGFLWIPLFLQALESCIAGIAPGTRWMAPAGEIKGLLFCLLPPWDAKIQQKG
jgi:hypothetical protein